MPTTRNKYNAPVSIFRALLSPTFTLAAPADITFPSDATGTPFAYTKLACYDRSVSGGAAENVNLSDLTGIVRRVALFANFADGLLWDDADGPVKIMLQLSRHSNPAVAAAMSGTTAMPLFFPVLNTWMEMQERITPYDGDAGIGAFYKLICGRPVAQCPEITLKTVGIDTNWNGAAVRFFLMVEFEHTFALT